MDIHIAMIMRQIYTISNKRIFSYIMNLYGQTLL
jgi:hypothetical protein